MVFWIKQTIDTDFTYFKNAFLTNSHSSLSDVIYHIQILRFTTFTISAHFEIIWRHSCSIRTTVPWFFNNTVHRHISTQGSVPISTQCFLENGLDVWELLHSVRSDTVRFLKDAVNVPLMPTALRILQQRIKQLQTSWAEKCCDECVKNWHSLGTSAG